MRQSQPEQASLNKLRKDLLLRVILYGGVIASGFSLLGKVWHLSGAWFWLALALSTAVYQFRFLWRNLHENRPEKGAPLYPVLGWANEVSILRGVLFAMLAGFLISPSEGALAWAPGVLYLAAVSMDFLDGYLARVTGMVSRLGGALDMELDSLGLLIAAAAGIFHGKIQAIYLLLGLARFVFVFGINRRQKAMLPVYDLDDSMIRRALAGAQMGFLAAALLPVFPGLVTQAASLVFMIPSLAHFWRDWLWVSGKIGKQAGKMPFQAAPFARFWLPLLFRMVLVGLVGAVIWQELRMPVPDALVLVVGSVALPALIVGAAGRITALGVLLLSGFALRDHPAALVYWLTLLAGIGVLIGGTGAHSLWTPENWLIYHRAGEGPAMKSHSGKPLS